MIVYSDEKKKWPSCMYVQATIMRWLWNVNDPSFSFRGALMKDPYVTRIYVPALWRQHPETEKTYYYLLAKDKKCVIVRFLTPWCFHTLPPTAFAAPLWRLICFCSLYISLLLFVSLFLLWEASQKAPRRDLTLFYAKHGVWQQELANRDEVRCNAIEKQSSGRRFYITGESFPLQN